MPRYIIVAHRSGGSIFGAAKAVAKKKDGSYAVYNSKAAAIAQARKWSEGLSTSNVRYTVEAE